MNNTSRFLSPTSPGGLLSQIQNLLPSEKLVIQSITTGQYFFFNETPSGTVGGGNKTFTLLHSPNPAQSLELAINGIKQTYTTDYSVTGSTITMANAPMEGDIIKCNYTVSPV